MPRLRFLMALFLTVTLSAAYVGEANRVPTPARTADIPTLSYFGGQHGYLKIEWNEVGAHESPLAFGDSARWATITEQSQLNDAEGHPVLVAEDVSARVLSVRGDTVRLALYPLSDARNSESASVADGPAGQRRAFRGSQVTLTVVRPSAWRSETFPSVAGIEGRVIATTVLRPTPAMVAFVRQDSTYRYDATHGPCGTRTYCGPLVLPQQNASTGPSVGGAAFGLAVGGPQGALLGAMAGAR